MKRRAILTSLAGVGVASVAAAPQTKPLLIVSGRIGRVNNKTTDTYDFSEAAFLKLPQTSIKTGQCIAVVTDPVTKQPAAKTLGSDQVNRRSDQEGFNPHVEQTVDRCRGIIGMQG